jgi:hypothetical protein
MARTMGGLARPSILMMGSQSASLGERPDEVSQGIHKPDRGDPEQKTRAREFRNLIHPGRSARLGKVCDRGTALSASAAVELACGIFPNEVG